MRAKLVEAREKRGWSQVKAAKVLGIDDATLQRWEQGVSKPRGYNKQRLCEIYGRTAWELDLEGIGTITDSESVIVPGNALLETKLLTHILQWPRNRLDYGELRGKIRKEIGESMTSEINRRRALELLATLPISVFGLSPLNAVIGAAAEEVMPWCASGVTACWNLGRGSDLALASSIVSAYIPTLTSFTANTRHRKAAASLAAQAWLLKATLGWHIESLGNALQYALEADRYAEMAEDYTLQIDALHRLGMVYYYGKRYDQALAKLEEAKGLIEHHSIPRTLPRTIYLDLAAYQACNGNTSEANAALKKAHKYFSASDDDSTAQMLGYDMSDPLRWEGLALSHLGQHKEALGSYGQISDQGLPTAERIRVELLCNQLHSKLRLKERDMEECMKLWNDAITGAKSLQSEQRFNEALALYETMECIWPGELRIAELKPQLAHW